MATANPTRTGWPCLRLALRQEYMTECNNTVVKSATKPLSKLEREGHVAICRGAFNITYACADKK